MPFVQISPRNFFEQSPFRESRQPRNPLANAAYVKFMEIQELETQITQAGFQIIETGNHPAAPPSRYIVAKKLA